MVEYNTALRNLVKANAQLLQVKYEYIFKTQIIRFCLSGRVLWDPMKWFLRKLYVIV